MNKVKMEEITMYKNPHLSVCAVKKQIPISKLNFLSSTKNIDTITMRNSSHPMRMNPWGPIILKIRLLLSITFALLILPAYRGFAEVEVYRHARVKPVAHDAVELSGGFWGEVRTRSREVGVPTLLEQFEKHGHIENFRTCATQSDHRHYGGPNANEFLYKQFEAMGWYATESPLIAALDDWLAATILAAQQPDGYLNTFYENPRQKHGGSGLGKPKQRFQPLNRFEFYNFAHFTQAAIAHYRATGNRVVLDAAIKFADLIVAKFADPNDLPYQLNRGPVNQKYEHPNHELAMVELYRVTGDRRYLDFALQTYTEYGYFAGEQFNEMWGHSVQENLLEAGAVDLYLETGDERLREVVSRLWKDVVERKMYITGGTGSTHHGEAYGKAHELPNATAYSETCAAIVLTFWHHKMLLASGDTKYADEMERTLYNGVLAGYGLNGWTYFYRNPLDWDPANPQRPGQRFVWHDCPCCPPNLHRLFATLDQYIFTQDDTGIQVNLYADSTLIQTLPDGNSLKIELATGYPWKEIVKLKITASPKSKGALKLRIPGWCDNPSVKIDGKRVAGVLEGGYLVLNEPWKHGNTIELTLPMLVRVIEGNSKVKDQVGRLAILRGPLVYCVEQADNPGLDLDRLLFPEEPELATRFEPDLLGGIVRIETTAIETGDDGEEREVAVRLIPYFAWANREPGRMMVWLPN